MRDPFEVLRGSDVTTADIDADIDVGQIRARARRIGRRQRMLMGGSAAAVAAVALIAVLVSVDSRRVSQTDDLAREQRVATPLGAEEGAVTEGTSSDAKGYEQEATADGTSSSGAAVSGDATAQAPMAPPAPGAEGSATVPEPLVAKVSATGRVLGGADFTLEVCNTAKSSVERTFGNSQRYDFVVKRGKDVVWRWEDGRSFAQVTGKETWTAGQCREWNAQWDGTTSGGGRAPSGTYTVVGTLAGKDEVASDPKSFCSGVC